MGAKLNVYNTIRVILRYPPSCLCDFNECVNTLLVPTFWPYFHFDPYFFILLLLVLKWKKSPILVPIITHLTKIVRDRDFWVLSIKRDRYQRPSFGIMWSHHFFFYIKKKTLKKIQNYMNNIEFSFIWKYKLIERNYAWLFFLVTI